ncbi:Protein WALLS ARE THIN 1 [Zostera marina]|uniref:WAT1-related protein n=2 Tax=Zostera marina TaxID=29655 RepID=A0A0K9NSZ3_ZOSMR|nr:Protein WALLS ARE THIN 1 [Zostera marina]
MKLLLGVLVLQICVAGMSVVSALSLKMGVSKLVFTTYRNFIGFLFLAPFAYFLEKKERPPLTLSLLLQFFLIALIGITLNQWLFLLGLSYLSSTFSSAILNTVPAMIFIMSVGLRIEKVSLTDRYGWGKLVGTLTTMAGAIVITLFKGPVLLLNSSSLPQIDMISKWTLGCIFMFGACLARSSWLVLQDPLLKKYPAKLTLTAYTCLFGSIQLAAISAITERDVEMWKIESRGVLLALLYNGVIVSGMCFPLQAWCINGGGPFFVGIFDPVKTMATAVLGFFLLGDKLYSGGIIGGLIIVIGLYLVLWGRSGENNQTEISNDQTSQEHDINQRLLNEDEEIC